MARFEPIDQNESFPQMEERVLARWREADVFHASLEQRKDAPRWVFYEGPPTANGRPGSHHVLSRVFKDVFPRYRTMRGYRVDRKAGWDCHGLPVELEIERELGLSSKDEIERYGIAEFNAKCRESVFKYVEEWNQLTERIGFWIDLDDPYVTLSNEYVESIWWSLREIWDKDMLYEGHRVVPYCPRCGTALSSHEVALGYKDVKDPSVYVRFPVVTDDGIPTGESLLVWTTTPWTLAANVAVAVAPEVTYVRAKIDSETLILAEPLVEKVLGEDAQIIDRFPGQKLVDDGTVYVAPFEVKDHPQNGAHLPVIEGDFVTVEDGTGLVHLAPAFGEDDYRTAGASPRSTFDPTRHETLFNPVKPDGTYDERVVGFEGRFVKDEELTSELIAKLESQGLLFRQQVYEHSYPHCWRCGTPLIYYAKASWYIKTTQVRDKMLAGNEGINWYPPHIKHGRFGNWLENNVDWALSRERYWGTPLPVWRCTNEDCDHQHCIGSYEELEGLAGRPVEDPHRPYIDDFEFPCQKCAQPMRRVPEVIDAWYDSGAMPFAQWHYPFENKELFDQRFPAQYICEALDQTRGWFYSLLAVSTLLFDKPSYETVLCLGLILDPEGQKMSKSRGNVVAPQDVLDQHGADAFRWYYFTSKEPWAGYRFSTETVGESVRKFLLTLWNTFGFLVLYANAGDEDGKGAPAPAGRDDLDRWALSRLQGLTEFVTNRLDDYDVTAAGRAIAEYVDELSNWYVRRSRRRFWDADPAAIATLRECMLGVSKLLAPFTPFVADEIYTRLSTVGDPESVHLCDWPAADNSLRDKLLEQSMEVARAAVELGRAARSQANIKVRQPLGEAVVVATGEEREAIARFEPLILEELNVKQVRYVTDADELARFELRPNFRALGPRMGKHMPEAKQAIAALDAASVNDALKAGMPVGINVAGDEHTLGPDDLQVVLAPLDGYQLEREGTHAVALELTITDGLRREGLAREVVHAVQNARKAAGLDVEDRIALSVGGDEELIAAAREHQDYIGGETLATSIELDPAAVAGGEPVEVEGHALRISLTRA
jgi:isoleucyl-tRNA synthetase